MGFWSGRRSRVDKVGRMRASLAGKSTLDQVTITVDFFLANLDLISEQIEVRRRSPEFRFQYRHFSSITERTAYLDKLESETILSLDQMRELSAAHGADLVRWGELYAEVNHSGQWCSSSEDITYSFVPLISRPWGAYADIRRQILIASLMADAYRNVATMWDNCQKCAEANALRVPSSADSWRPLVDAAETNHAFFSGQATKLDEVVNTLRENIKEAKRVAELAAAPRRAAQASDLVARETVLDKTGLDYQLAPLAREARTLSYRYVGVNEVLALRAGE